MAENNAWPTTSENLPLNQMNNPVEDNESNPIQTQSNDDGGEGCFSKIKCLWPTCLQGKKRDLDPERGSIENGVEMRERENIDEDDEENFFENLEGSDSDEKW